MEYLLTAGVAICTVAAAFAMALWVIAIFGMIIQDCFKD